MSSAVALRHLAGTELRVHWRHGLLPATGAMTTVWALVLLTVPRAWRAPALPWVLLLDLAALGLFFAPALAVVERANGVPAALGLTRLSPARALTVRIAALAATALGAALVLVLATGAATVAVGPVLLGALLTSALLSLLATVLLGRRDTLTAYMARVPGVGVVLLLPALISGTGLGDHAVLWLSPATGALQLLSGRWSWAATGWITVWLAVLWWRAAAIGFGEAHSRGAPPPAPHPLAPLGPLRGTGHWRAVRSFARVDRRTLLDDRLLLLLVAGVPLLALGGRWLAGPGLGEVQARIGLDLAPHLPVVWALVLVLHTPVMFGAVAGLLFLEDRDAGVLPAIALTPAALGTLLVYRLSAAAAATAAGVALGLTVAGAAHPTGPAGVLATAVAAGAVALVPALLMAALVRDRAQGMALMKALGVPLYLPLAGWYLEGPAAWLFVVIPTSWAVRAFWAQSAPAAAAFAAAAIGAGALVAALVLPRLRRSLLR